MVARELKSRSILTAFRYEIILPQNALCSATEIRDPDSFTNPPSIAGNITSFRIGLE